VGVDFHPGDAHWSYGGFHEFRKRLADAEGIDLEGMAGFRRKPYPGVPGVRSWDDVATPLAPLLHHSDCDGELTREECAQVAPRLREILDQWAEEQGIAPGEGHLRDYDVWMGRKLASAMEEVAAGGHDRLEFT
jgi:hypothetical protein